MSTTTNNEHGALVFACRTCKGPTPFVVDLIPNPRPDFQPDCPNCWEVEHRLGVYLLSENGRKFVTELLRKLGHTVWESSIS